mmetsp:Transcript_46373/g.89375  ORF Transcript_46373/g.89375 Transcript_46373/m.89375 type:complete len:448 (+) Transcript_46373:167-1510(+)
MGSLQADPYGSHGYCFGALDPGRIWTHVEQLTSILNVVVGSQQALTNAGIRCRCGSVVYPQPGQKLVGTSYLATTLQQVETQAPFTVQAGCAVGQRTSVDAGPGGVVDCHPDGERQSFRGKPDQQYTWAPGVSVPPQLHRNPEVPTSSRFSALSDSENSDDVEQQSPLDSMGSFDDESRYNSISRRQTKSAGTPQPSVDDGIDMILHEFGIHGKMGDATVVQLNASETSRSSRHRATRTGHQHSEQHQQQPQQASVNGSCGRCAVGMPGLDESVQSQSPQQSKACSNGSFGGGAEDMQSERDNRFLPPDANHDCIGGGAVGMLHETHYRSLPLGANPDGCGGGAEAVQGGGDDRSVSHDANLDCFGGGVGGMLGERCSLEGGIAGLPSVDGGDATSCSTLPPAPGMCQDGKLKNKEPMTDEARRQARARQIGEELDRLVGRKPSQPH